MKYSLVFLSFLVLMSCSSIPSQRPVYQPPKPTDALTFARKASQEGRIIEAVAWLMRLNNPELDSSDVWNQIKEKIPQVYQAYMNEAKYQSALNLVSFAQRVTPNILKVNEHEIQVQVATKLREKGFAAAAIEWILAAAKIAPLEAALAQDWLNYMVGELNRGAVRRWLAYHPRLTLTTEQREWLESPTAASDWLQGTVTVLVNRGIKIERGVGMPDIMVGSAFYIDRRGYLLTNYHVIQSEVDPEYKGYSRLNVIPANSRGERLPAKVVAWDRNLDLALLKVERPSSYVFSLSDLPQVKQGERVFVLGSPAGLESTVTSGIVSALNRSFLPAGSAIQIDAPVNPGNSGGPVLNSSGELIGIIFAGAPNFEGLNFAIDAKYLVPILTSLYQGDEVKRPWLGFGVYEGVDFLEINHIFPLGPAEEAGLPLGSRLISVNGVKVRDPSDVHLILSSMPVGGLVTVEWTLNQQTGTAYILSRERPKNPIVLALQRDSVESLAPHLLGMTLMPMGERMWQNYRVIKVYPNTPADQLNLSDNDLVIVQRWQVDPKLEQFLVQLFTKRRQGGYLESVVTFGLNLNPYLSL
jgi:serine protease Do